MEKGLYTLKSVISVLVIFLLLSAFNACHDKKVAPEPSPVVTTPHVRLYDLMRSAKSDLEKGKYGQALEKLNKAREIAPEKMEIYRELATTYFFLDDRQSALDNINRAIEMAPDDSQLFFIQGNIFMLKKDYDSAFKSMRQAVELDEYNGGAYDKLGDIYYYKRNFSKALELWEKAMKTDPEGPYIGQIRRKISFLYNFRKKGSDKGNEPLPGIEEISLGIKPLREQEIISPEDAVMP